MSWSQFRDRCLYSQFSFIISLHYYGTIIMIQLWCRVVVVIVTAQLHSTKPELRFCAGSNPARDVSEVRDGEDL